MSLSMKPSMRLPGRIFSRILSLHPRETKVTLLNFELRAKRPKNDEDKTPSREGKNKTTSIRRGGNDVIATSHCHDENFMFKICLIHIIYP